MINLVYTISQDYKGYVVTFITKEGDALLNSLPFECINKAPDVIQKVKLHICFQSNFVRKTYGLNAFGFEVRTCWDDLVAESIIFNTRQEIEEAMYDAQNASKKAQYSGALLTRNVA